MLSLDVEAVKITLQTGVSRQSFNHILFVLRERIVCLCEQESVFDRGRVEFDEGYDEGYFEAERVRGKRGREANGKRTVFCLIKWGGNVYHRLSQFVL